MRALVKAKPEPGLWLADVPRPQIGPNDVLIRVTKTAICGTDLHIHGWDAWAQETIPIGMTIGHEFTGVIEEVGSHVAGYEVGMRVSGEGHLTCGHCRNCRAGRRHLCRNTVGVGVNRDGAFADYVAIPATNAFVVPDDISDDVAAYLDPLGNAVHTALSFDLVGEDVLITGAGPIGLMAVAIARHVGARHITITDLSPYRLALAERMGASRTVDVRSDSLDAAMDDLAMVEGFDVGLEMSGVEVAIADLLDHMNHGGRIALLGIPSAPLEIDLNEIIFKGLQLKGIYGREMFETWYKAAAMLSSGLDVTPVLTHRFAAEDFAEAFEVLRSGECGKVLLEWSSKSEDG